MNTLKEKISAIKELIKTESTDQAVMANLGNLSFVIGLLPIPGVQQAGKIAERIISKRSLREKFDSLKSEIGISESRIENLENGFEKLVLEIETIKANQKCQDLLKAVLDGISQEASELLIETKNWSSQEVVNSLISVDTVTILSDNNSYNHLMGVKVESKKTVLSATNNSKNIVSNAEFRGPQGAIGMQSIDQVGRIEIKDASVGFAQNSTVGMGNFTMGADANGNFVIGTRSQIQTWKATCPRCSHEIQLGTSRPIPGMTLNCPTCGFAGRI